MIKYSMTMHEMYPDGKRKLARTGMRNKLFILHDLISMRNVLLNASIYILLYYQVILRILQLDLLEIWDKDLNGAE